VTESDSVLATNAVTKAFGGIRAVDRCTLAVRRGTITGLIGPNGAGKTTLFNLIVGLYAPDDGTITFNGRRIDGRPAYEIVERGVVKTFQIPREFRRLTVLENLLVAHPRHPGENPISALLGLRKVWDVEETLRKRALDMLALVELDTLSDAYASDLSGGQKKLLELARALMTEPRLVLLDEPVAGVNPTLTRKLLGLLNDLRARGKSFFMIEHDMDVVMNQCDRVIAMHQGRPIAEGMPEEVRSDSQVLESYLGG
jgi:branched-chain amino acid transport system ATP-binding protein